MKTRFLILLVSSPLLFSIFLNFPKVMSEWGNTPQYIQTKISQITNEERISRIGAVQFSGVSKIFVNKSFIILDEGFEYLSRLSPKMYFNSSSLFEGLFFMFIFGLIYIVKKEKYKILFLTVLSVLPAYLVGKIDVGFLFPAALCYLYISLLGINSLKYSKQIFILAVIIQIYMTLKYLFI